ncbi:MAG: pilus assembly protein [Planctomycetales bacterium]|nr:pilus assembly protein [Planctomycetales bacterium]
MELAICLPVIVLIFLASLETANTIYLKQGITAAAYEAARVATASGGTEVMALTRANEILGARGIVGAQVTITPTVDADTERGTELTIHIRVSCSRNSTGIGDLFQGRYVESTVVMVRL